MDVTINGVKYQDHIASLDLPIRTYNVLARAGIIEIDNLQYKSDGELLALPYFTPDMFDHIQDAIYRHRSQ